MVKQQITIEQFNKLSVKHKEILSEWLQSTSEFKGELLPTIGQMIQFINEKKPIKSISKTRFDKWIVNIDTSILGYKDELCDSLWETVTRIL